MAELMRALMALAFVTLAVTVVMLAHLIRSNARALQHLTTLVESLVSEREL